MNTYDLCKRIQKVINIKAAEVFVYSRWSDDFAATKAKEIPKVIIDCDWFFRIDPNDLTLDQMTELDFGLWSDDNPIRLIPLWLYPFLVDELIVGRINGGELETTKREDMDNDHRFGNIAYGVMPK